MSEPRSRRDERIDLKHRDWAQPEPKDQETAKHSDEDEMNKAKIETKKVRRRNASQ